MPGPLPGELLDQTSARRHHQRAMATLNEIPPHFQSPTFHTATFQGGKKLQHG
jgi:hypothetical protein